MKEEEKSNMFNLRLINQVRSHTPYAPPITYIQDDTTIHDFNRAMVNVSIGLAQDIMVEKLIWNIKVSIIKKVYATIKNERHHLVTPKILTGKWGIGLKKTKDMLRAT